ncbi:MAG: carboxypeptidase-like regulatory domain-containing protein, partial [Thermoanaerobaculia bacterium]
MRSARIPVAVLVASLLTATAAAQVPSPTGNLYGTVVDEQGRPLPNVTTTLAGPGASRAATSDTKGDFHFLNLSPGAYGVTLEHAGFETVRRAVAVLLGKNAVFSVTMPVAGAAVAVAVSGDAPVVDSRKTETGANFGRKELQTIPTTRDPWAILQQVSGVLLADINVGDGPREQSGFVGKGSHSDQNTFNLDGVGITDI